MKKTELELELSKLKLVENPKVFLEQYGTHGDIAAEALWLAYISGDIENKVVLDLGCGNGILGIGALLLNAKKVYFVDIDKDSINVCKENLKMMGLDGEVLLKDVNLFDKKVDTVLQNPPFGVQVEHADKRFLERAMVLSNVIYSIHKIESEKFIKKLARDKGFSLVGVKAFRMKLKKTQKFHTSDSYSVKVGCFRIIKI
jgi:putative methylase